MTDGGVIKELSFSVEEFKGRVRAVQKIMEARGLDALLITTPENIFYLSGFHTPGYFAYQCLIVPASGDPTLVVRNGEIGNADAFCWLSSFVRYADGADPVKSTLEGLSVASVGRSATVGCELKSWFLTASVYLGLQDSMRDNTLVACDGIVEACRVIKSPAEIAYIREAAKVAEAGMVAAIGTVQEGKRDTDIAASLHAAMYAAGGEYPAAGPYVAVGRRSSIMHGIWGRVPIRRGDTINLEIGGVYHRYNAGIMRCVSVGEPSEEVRRMAEAAEAANSAVIDRVRPGAMTSELHGAAAKTLEDHGFGGARKGRRCGYSIGIAFPPDWGEGHIVSIIDTPDTELRSGMVFHLPLSVRSPNRCGVAFSETVVVTESGREVLGTLERRLAIAS